MRSDAQRNRGAIVDAARDLVARHGDDVTMDALATRAGVAVGTLYRHFPTKSDLVRAVVDDTVERVADLAEQARAHPSAWDGLTWFFTALDDGHSAGRAVRMAAHLLGVDRDDHPVDGGAARARSAVDTLLVQAKDAGDMRTDITLADLFMLMAQAPERGPDDRRARYVEIVKAGLRPVSPDAESPGPTH